MAQLMVAIERHSPLWIGSLAFFSAILSLGFACAAPLAAFAAIGAVTLRRRDLSGDNVGGHADLRPNHRRDEREDGNPEMAA